MILVEADGRDRRRDGWCRRGPHSRDDSNAVEVSPHHEGVRAYELAPEVPYSKEGAGAGGVDARVREVDDLGSGEGEGGRGGRVLFEGRRVDEIFPLTNCPRHQHLIIELANANENEDF